MFRRLCFAFSLTAAVLLGHDMVHEGAAGPYRLTVYLNPHARQPNVVEILTRSESEAVEELLLALGDVDSATSEAAYSSLTTTADEDDPNLFRASLPLPPQAFWRLHVEARGAGGEGSFSIPVAAAAPAVGLTPSTARLISVVFWAAAVAACVFFSSSEESDSLDALPQNSPERLVETPRLMTNRRNERHR